VEWGRTSQDCSYLFCDSESTIRSIRRSGRTPFYSHWFRLSVCSGPTKVRQRWLAFHPTWSSGCSRCWLLLLGLCFLHRDTTALRPSWHSCTGWRCRSASSLSWLFWYTDAYTRQLRRTLLRNSISHLLTRLVSVSALHRHHRLLSHAPVFQPSAIELFHSLLLDCGTFCRWTSLRRRQYLFSGNIWRPISSVILSCSTCAVTLSFRTIDLFLLTYNLTVQSISVPNRFGKALATSPWPRFGVVVIGTVAFRCRMKWRNRWRRCRTACSVCSCVNSHLHMVFITIIIVITIMFV